jgi:hypothetical protein
MSNEIPIRKRTPEEILEYLVFQFSVMRVEVDIVKKDLEQIQRKLGMKEPPKPFKKKPPKEQQAL